MRADSNFRTVAFLRINEPAAAERRSKSLLEVDAILLQRRKRMSYNAFGRLH